MAATKRGYGLLARDASGHGRRRPTDRPTVRGVARLVVVALLATTVALLAPSAAAPAAAVGQNPAALRLGPPLRVISVDTGAYFTCAILEGGSVKCWGNNQYGQLGQGSTATIGDQPGELAATPPIDLGQGRTATALALGQEHACALLDNGTVKCWGRNQSGQLGQNHHENIGDQPGEMAALPSVTLGGGRAATGVSASQDGTCALLADRAVRCWGSGHGWRTNDMDWLSDVALGVPRGGGARHTVAVTGGGPRDSNAYTDTGAWCVLLLDPEPGYWDAQTSNNVRCRPNDGTLTDPGDHQERDPIALGRPAIALDRGDGQNYGTHTCVVLDNGSVKCWGRGEWGRLGQGGTANVTDALALAPVNLGAGRAATAVSAGGWHTCALLDNGTVKCWGYNGHGQLGQDSNINLGDAAGEMAALSPVNLGAGRTATAVSASPTYAGHGHTCAVLDDGSLKCWGANVFGELGQGSTTSLGDNPGEMEALAPVDLGTGPEPAAMTVELAADETTVQAGETIHYHLAVTNTGGPALSGFSVSAPNAPDCEQAIGGLAAGAHQTIDCTYTTAAADVGTYSVTATVDTAETEPVASNEVEVEVTAAPAPPPPAAPQTLAAGGNHTCTVLPSGVLKCWGANTNGQLGLGSTATLGDQYGDIAASPGVDLGVGRTAASVATGLNHTCAVLDDGTVKCWGWGGFGQLGQGPTGDVGDQSGEVAALPPVNLGAGRTATAVSAGFYHSCALLDDATVKCWGLNNTGQLGQGSTTTLGDDAGEMAALPAVNLGAGRTAVALSAGALHNCALLDNGTVKCWGYGFSGQLGQGSTAYLGDQAGEMAALAPVNLGAGRTAVAVSAGDSHSCAVLDDATLKCWGYGASGQLGQGSTATLGDAAGEMAALAPVNLGAGRTATSVSAGTSHSCAVLDDATLKCWGSGLNGRLGQNSTATLGDQPGEMAALVPVDFGWPNRPVVAVSAGQIHSCASFDDGSVKCWGAGNTGRLGQGDTYDWGSQTNDLYGLSPVKLEPDPPPPSMSVTLTVDEETVGVGETIHVHVLVENTGQRALHNVRVGYTNTPGCDATPFDLAAGEDRTLDCSHVATAGDVPVFYAVVGVYADELEIEGGQYETYSNNVEVAVTQAPPPPPAPPTIAAGAFHSCAILPSGAVKCWGNGGHGRLGLGSTATVGAAPGDMASLLPVALGAGRTATSVSVGLAHSCAVLDDGSVKCWGANDNGQLGQGSTENIGDQSGEMAALAPVDLGAGRTAVAVSAGWYHTCALLDDGSVKCWGDNGTGALGQGSTATLGDQPGEMAALAPVDLGAGRTAVGVSAGVTHTCAVLDDGSVKCWGFNTGGQLGQGSTATLGDQPGEMSALPAVDLGAGRTGVAVSAGFLHTCALLDDGSVKCWGFNSSGELGQGSTAMLGDQPGEMSALPAVDLGAGRTAVAVSAGYEGTCVVLDDGSVKCWGNGSFGRLGQGPIANLGDEPGEMAALAPVNLGAGGTATEVIAGAAHTCARLDDGSVKCWGHNDDGRLGQDSSTTLGDDPGEMAALAPVNLGVPMQVVLTVDEEFVQAGESVHYHLTVVNNSAAALTGIDYGTGLPGWVANGCSGPTEVASGQRSTVDCSYVTALDDVPELDLTATVDTDQTPPASSNTVSVPVTEPPPPSASMSVTLSADEETVEVGETIHLHALVENTGGTALHDVTLGETGLDCDSAPFDLAAGEDRTVDCTHVATAGDVPLFIVTVSYFADELLSEGSPYPTESNTVEVAVTEPPAASLSVEVSAHESSVSMASAPTFVRTWGSLGSGAGEFERPSGIAVGASGEVFVADGINHRVQVFSPAGGFLRQWGSEGSGDGEFSYPSGVAVDGAGQVYVVDQPDSRVQVFTAAGEFVRSFGTTGSGPGEFQNVLGIAVDGSGQVFVTDSENNRVQVFSPSGEFVRTWGTLGTGEGEFNFPIGVAVDSSGHVYVGDTGNDRVQVFTTTGEFVRQWGTPGDGDEQMSRPSSIAVDGSGNVYVADFGHHRLQVFTPSGQFVRTWGAPGDTAGEPEGLFSHPSGIAVDASGRVYTTESGYPTNMRVQVFEPPSAHLHVTVANTGNVALTDVTIDDVTPGCVVAPFDLAVGESRTVDCAHPVGIGDVPTFEFSALVSAAEVTTPVRSNTVAVTVVPPPIRSMSIVKSADEVSVSPGQPIHYHLVVTNTGNVPLTGVDVSDAAAPDCGDDALFDLAVGAFTTIDCTYTTSLSDVGVYENTASVVSAETAAQSSNTVSVTVRDALAVVKAAEETTVVEGGPVHLHVTVENASAVALTAVTISDPNGPDCEAAPFDLAVGEERTVDCTYVTGSGDVGTYTNVASVTANGVTTTVESNEVEVEVTASPAELSVEASADETSVAVSSPQAFVRSWGSPGTVAGAFDEPWGVAVAESGEVFVADRGNNRIEVFDASGAFVRQWGSGGGAPGELNQPYGVALSASGDEVFVTDAGNSRVQVFDPSGAFLRQWGTPGDGPGELYYPYGIALDSAGDVYVVDSNGRVQVFDPSGSLLRQFGSPGSGPGQFDLPQGIAIDAAGDVYVADSGNDRVQVFDSSGTFLRQWGSSGRAVGRFDGPSGVAIDASGNVNVSEFGNSRVQVFAPDGTFVRTFGRAGSGDGEFIHPRSVGVDDAGNVYVPDRENSRVVVFAPPSMHLHVTVTNTGEVALTDVTIAEVAPGCAVAPFGLAVGGSRTVDCVRPVGAGDVPTYEHSASVTAAEVTTPVVSDTVEVTVEPPAPVTALSIVKSADESQVVVGDTVHLHLQVANLGNTGLHDVTIDDPNGPDCEVAPFDLAAGEERTVDCEYTAVAGDVPTYSNVASVTADEVTTPVASNPVQVVVEERAPSLSIVKSADESGVSPGHAIHYHLVVTNTGNVPLTGVDVSDTRAPDCGDDPVFDLAVGGFVTIDCAYTTTLANTGEYRNTASVTAAQVATPVVSNRVDVEVGPAVSVLKTAEQEAVFVGDGIDYHVTVSNLSALPLEDLALSDANAPGCTQELAPLAPGEDVTVDCRYTTTAGDEGTYANVARVDSVDIESVDSNQVDVEVVEPAPGLSVVKSADEDAVDAGDLVHLHLAITNTGNVDLTGVTVDDPNGPDCEVAPFDLAVGADTTVDCTYATVTGDAPVYENTATVDADELTEPVVSNTVEVAVDPGPPAGYGTVSGVVATAGSEALVPGAMLALLSTADFSMHAGLQADGSGSFSGLVPVGSYYAYVIDPAGGHVAGFFGAPTTVTVTQGGSTTANPALAPTTGAIAGTMTGDGTGAPVTDGVFLSISAATGRPGPGALTDGSGHFRAGRVTPGSHLGAFIDLSGAHRVEFYDDAGSPAGSTPVSVTAGATRSAVDAALTPQAPPGGGSHLVGTVTGTGGAGPLEGVAVVALHAGDFSLAAGAVTDAQGHYDIDVDLGGYKLLFYDPSGARAAEWYNNVAMDAMAQSATVTTTAASPVRRRDASLAPVAGAATGTITDLATGDPIAGAWSVFLGPSGQILAAGVAGADGTWTVTGIPAAVVRATFVDPAGGHRQEFWDDGPTFPTADPITMSAGDTVTGIDAALTADG